MRKLGKDLTAKNEEIMDIKTEIELGARILLWTGAAYSGYRLFKAGIDSGISFFSQHDQDSMASEVRMQAQELTQVVNELEEVVAEGESVVAYGQENINRWEKLFEHENMERASSLGFKV